MNLSPDKLKDMANGNIIINIIAEIGYPGKTGGGITLRADQCFVDAQNHRETYETAEENMKKAVRKKTTDNNKDNLDTQAVATTKRVKKDNDKAEEANVKAVTVNLDVNNLCAVTAGIFVTNQQ